MFPRYIHDCARQRTAPSSLFSCPGFRLDHIALDSMHSGDLGVFPDAIGGLLYVEMSHKPWHNNFAAGVKWLNTQLTLLFGQSETDSSPADGQRDQEPRLLISDIEVQGS